MVAATHIPLGTGLYTPAQAARIARVSPALMTRWVHGDRHGEPALRPQLPGDPLKTVTFLDLIQTLAIRAIRLEKKVPLQKIREFVKAADERHGVSYPFARRHQTYLFDDDIVLRLADGRLVQITGRYREQDLIRQVAELYLEDLSFNPGGLAAAYEPFRWNGRSVVINPDIRLGDPIVHPAGVAVQTLVEAVAAEGSVERAAWAYEVEPDDVVAALRYNDLLLGIAA